MEAVASARSGRVPTSQDFALDLEMHGGLVDEAKHTTATAVVVIIGPLVLVGPLVVLANQLVVVI